MFVCVCFVKDLANRWTDMVLLYSEVYLGELELKVESLFTQFPQVPLEAFGGYLYL